MDPTLQSKRVSDDCALKKCRVNKLGDRGPREQGARSTGGLSGKYQKRNLKRAGPRPATNRSSGIFRGAWPWQAPENALVSDHLFLSARHRDRPTESLLVSFLRLPFCGMLWRDLKVWQVYGANTDVGKTIVSTIISRALQRRASPNGLLYLKPVSTGPQAEADDR